MRILVTGASGQVGTAIQNLWPTLYPHDEVIACTRSMMDFAAPDLQTRLWALLEKIQPDIIIHAAAYTQVDRAELPDELACVLQVNTESARIFADWCADQYIHSKKHPWLYFFSTDYVFDGRKPLHESYTETDTPNPLSVYGLSKWRAEQAIQGRYPYHTILRTSWVHSPYAHHRNFVNTMRTLLARASDTPTSAPIPIVSDQWGIPTSAVFLAKVTAHLAADPSQAVGLYHLTNAPVSTQKSTQKHGCSWYDFANMIAQEYTHIQAQNPFIPIDSDTYRNMRIQTTGLPVALRPYNSQLSNAKIAPILQSLRIHHEPYTESL